MKQPFRLMLLAAVLAAAGLVLPTLAAEKHDPRATPKGGRLLEKTEPHAEFVVEKDRTVIIHFYDEALKPVPVTTQNVVVQADAKTGRAKLVFEKKGDSLVSKTALPEGEGYNVVVQFRQAPEARPRNFRFKLDLSMCGGCNRLEYGCICDH